MPLIFSDITLSMFHAAAFFIIYFIFAIDIFTLLCFIFITPLTILP